MRKKSWLEKVDLFLFVCLFWFLKYSIHECGHFIVLHALSIYKVASVVLQRVERLTMVMMTAVTQMEMSPV